MLPLLLGIVACDAPAPDRTAPLPADPPTIDDRGIEDNLQIVPSPAALQAALDAGGVDVRMGSLVRSHDYDLSGTERPLTAIRLGVVIADTLLTAPTMDNATLLANLRTMQTGFAQVESGPAVADTLARLIAEVDAGALTGPALATRFPRLARGFLKALDAQGRAEVAPLIQAGGFLEGANLVARALAQTPDRNGRGDAALRQPDAVNYFIGFVSTGAEQHAPRDVRGVVLEVLLALKPIADGSEPITDEELQTVISSTESLLRQL